MQTMTINAPKFIHRGRGKNAEVLTIPRFNLPVAGGAQPAHLVDLISAKDSGFVQRWLFVFPDAPKKHHPATGRSPDMVRAKKYLSRVYELDLASITETKWRPTIIATSSDAAEYLRRWDKQTAEDLLPDGNTHEGGWISKCWKTARRLALTLEVLWWASHESAAPTPKVAKRAKDIAAMADPERNDNEPQRRVSVTKLRELCNDHGLDFDDLMAGGSGVRRFDPKGPTEVSLKAMAAACGLLRDYYYPHLMRVLGAASPMIEAEAAVNLTRTLAVKGLVVFNDRELRQGKHGSVHRLLHRRTAGGAQQCGEILDYLAERNIIRRVNAKTGGRPKGDFEVNPTAMEGAKRILAKRV